MILKRFHIERPDQRITPLFVEAGFTPVFSESRKQAAGRLQALGLPLPEDFLLTGGSEVLVSKAGDWGAVVTRAGKSAEGTKPPRYTFDVTIIAPSAPEKQIEETSTILGSPLLPHSSEEATRIEEISKLLGVLSPNGRCLAESRIRETVRLLYDDGIRAGARAWVAVFGDKAVHQKNIEAAFPNPADSAAFVPLQARRDLTEVRYLITCDRCNAPASPGFMDQGGAEAALQNSDRRCHSCGANALLVREGWAAREGILRGIQQGLWLESLAADVVGGTTDALWAGQMAGSNEMDCLAVISTTVVLIECKDTTVGQNDLYIALAKAQHIGASELILIGTGEAAITAPPRKDGQLTSSGQNVTILSDPTSEGLRRKLSSKLDAVAPRDPKSVFRARRTLTFDPSFWNQPITGFLRSE